MSDRNTPDGTDDGVSRRSFMRTTGALGAAAALGVPASDAVSAADGDSVSTEFTNVRVQEALNAWERGYRGRTDRTLGLTDSGVDTRHPDLGPWSGVTATTEGDELEVDGNPFANTGGNVNSTTTKTVGWHNDIDRYGVYEKPRDSNGHGTHVASIMAGSGRASAVDADRYVEDDPFAVLILGDVLSYEVDAEAGTGVFAAVDGELVEVAIEGPDGQELDASSDVVGTSLQGPIFAETPTVHDEGEATYTVYVRPQEGELVSTGTVDRVGVGAFLDNTDTAGDRVDAGDDSLHAGVAPNASILGLSGLSGPVYELGDHANEFTETFNLRAVNMSWGYIGGLPLGATGELDDIPAEIKTMANAGILTVAAAGNSATPANGNGAPAVVNEAISVVATGARDGIAAYSSGGLAGIDQNDEPYMKPDVTAIGGTVNVTEIAALQGEPEADVTVEDPDDAAADAELEPVEEFDDLESDDLEPTLTVDDDVLNGLDYEYELSDEVADELEDATIDTSLDAPLQGAKREGDGRDGVRDYTGKAGTSMAAPSVCGMSGLVANALEFDAPDAISIDEPAAADLDDVFQIKTTILATASETALTAAPFHRAKAPTYSFGGRDPYEGYGRANVGPALDAATRDLTDQTVSGEVGLAVPTDERAEAGHVRVTEPGEVTAEVEFSHYGGGNSGATRDDPHIDLFLYDAQNPDPQTGDPVVVARDAGTSGDADVSASVSVDDLEANGGERVFYVVAKLVNVPGVVNGFDVQAYFDLSTAFDPEGFVVEGARDGDASVYTGGQTARDLLDVDVRFPDDEEVIVRDFVPEEWDVDEEFGDVEATTPALGGGTYVYFGLDDPQSSYEDLTRFAQAPDDVEESERYTFGPIAVSRDTDDDGTLTSREYTTISGTSRSVTVVAEET